MTTAPPNTTRAFHASGFRAIRMLGTGAHSHIWQVRDIQTNRVYAMKSVLKGAKADDRYVEQTLNEYSVAKAVQHPNIRKIYSLRKVRKLFSVREIRLLMEFCPGCSVQEQRPQEVLETCTIFAQVANALAKMNECGYIHADMKPNNIIVDDDGNARIIDFGQSCKVGTVKERIQGTPDYIAPEQVKRWPLDARTDVFNFGASLYWALTGKAMPSILPRGPKVPHSGRQPVQAANVLNPAVPPLLARLVSDCTQLEAKERPNTMQEVVNRMGIILRKELVPVEPS
ncbi:MAG: protein kinase [Planctomycetes bacterium]|jgi:serine/threonine-protein kinase|nr:serine/threonine protein kinase [Phycisphaerae bacterium]NBB94272.1 protein kinase [Planctomycetota bacterium]